MAIFGKLDELIMQVVNEEYFIAFNYIRDIIKNKSLSNNRLLSLDVGTFEKVNLHKENFALEQVYFSKERSECFFESHKKYIDVQFILEGEEIIEVASINNAEVDIDYDKKLDLVKYMTINNSSKIYLQKGDMAIFYPTDVHMPCLKVGNSVKVIKTVVKVPIND